MRIVCMNQYDARPSATLRVAVSTPSRFHAIDLAEQLDLTGNLSALYTALPRGRVPVGLHHLASTFPSTLGPAWIMNRFAARVGRPVHRMGVAAFDSRVASALQPCDVFHCMSGFGVKSHLTAKDRFGALTVCDRGSSHIEYQDEILAQEHREWKIPYNPIDHVTIA